ncbi:MAG: AraC family transcriptional regulator [Tannerellaceae bacterium]|jgi:AraC-like DNA-binding protein|nr:AraC family transcriptional regulator [Tannerellaceae bacterium]
MLYKEYQPDALLSPYIETYWISNGFTGERKSYKILPDGCVDIIFSVDKTKNTFYAGIAGTMTTFLNVNNQNSVQMFGIRFKPMGITAFTRVSVEEFTDRNVELTSVETLFGKSFYDTLPEKQLAEEIIKHTDNYLINRLPYLYRSDRQIIRAVDLIYLAKGQVSLSETASNVCLCQRHFERKFKCSIGVSPKTFAGIIRFKYALRYLRSHPHSDLLSVAVECGYYDHAHLIKDFKILSGDTPGKIRR